MIDDFLTPSGNDSQFLPKPKINLKMGSFFAQILILTLKICKKNKFWDLVSFWALVAMVVNKDKNLELN